MMNKTVTKKHKWDHESHPSGITRSPAAQLRKANDARIQMLLAKGLRLLCPSEFIIYVRVLDLTLLKGASTCSAPVNMLQRGSLGIIYFSERKISRYLKNLEKHGLIKKLKGSWNDTVVYLAPVAPPLPDPRHAIHTWHEI